MGATIYRGVIVRPWSVIPAPARLEFDENIAELTWTFGLRQQSREYRRTKVDRVVHYQWPRLRQGVAFLGPDQRRRGYVGFKTFHWDRLLRELTDREWPTECQVGSRT
jgi:hypothetical protein